jgi:2-polyprenyl-3-methyl-5-hydroxy-6-metoxy-1,4-benzoquinol methylase
MTNTEVIQSWATVPRAAIESVGEEGDFLRQHLLNPTLFALLGPVEGKEILDAGCGYGYLARMLARRGARVTAVEPAESFFHYAAERERTERLGIRYVQADLSTFRDYAATFDVVIASMVLMDIPDYLPAMQNCMDALRSGGSFIFSLAHPCFEGTEREYQDKGCVEVKEYLAEYCLPQPFGCLFHRPLSHYLNAVIQRGCALQKVVEPKLDAAYASAAPEHARNVHVPSFIVIRAVKLPALIEASKLTEQEQG